MRDYFLEVLHARRLQVDSVKGHHGVLEVPQIDAEVVCRQKVFTVGGDRKRVNVEIVTALVDVGLDPLCIRANEIALGELNLAPFDPGTAFLLDHPFIFELPELDHSVVCRQQLEATLLVRMQELKSIDFLV